MHAVGRGGTMKPSKHTLCYLSEKKLGKHLYRGRGKIIARLSREDHSRRIGVSKRTLNAG